MASAEKAWLRTICVCPYHPIHSNPAQRQREMDRQTETEKQLDRHRDEKRQRQTDGRQNEGPWIPRLSTATWDRKAPDCLWFSVLSP